MATSPILEKVPQLDHEPFHCEVIRGSSYQTRWHFHPELQITLALRSSGHRIVGDHIGTLGNGDLVMVGADLPHVWQQEEKKPANAVHAIVLRFRETFLGSDFLARTDLAQVRHLFTRSSRGLHFGEYTRSLITPLLLELPETMGLRRITQFLTLLDTLAKATDTTPLASISFRPALDPDDEARMNRILRFIDSNLCEEITRDAVARSASLSPDAFSRYFHSRTGKTLPAYVNELRIGRACRRLQSSSDTVSDIALDCGFTNLANFNRWFLKITLHTPRDYRQRVAASQHKR